MAEASQRAVRPPAEVAFIGLGNMGEPMAARLVGAGYRVRGFDNSPETRERVAGATGVVAARSLEEAVSAADAVVAMLPTGKVVRAVAEQMRGSLRRGAVIVDMSSSEPIGTRTLGEELIAEGFDQHIPKGYIYFAMGFSVFVELLNMRLRKKSSPVDLHERYAPEPGPQN